MLRAEVSTLFCHCQRVRCRGTALLSGTCFSHLHGWCLHSADVLAPSTQLPGQCAIFITQIAYQVKQFREARFQHRKPTATGCRCECLRLTDGQKQHSTQHKRAAGATWTSHTAVMAFWLMVWLDKPLLIESCACRPASGHTSCADHTWQPLLFLHMATPRTVYGGARKVQLFLLWWISARTNTRKERHQTRGIPVSMIPARWKSMENQPNQPAKQTSTPISAYSTIYRTLK